MQEAIETLLEKGLTQRVVAAKLGISLSTVHRRAPKTNRTYTPEEKQDMVDLYLTGLSERQVAAKFNTSQTVVRNALGDTPRHPRKPKEKRKEYLSADQNAIIKNHWLVDKWTKTKIANKLKVSFNTVSKAIIAMGIEDDQEVNKLKMIHPTKGKIPIKVPGVKGTYYVRPENIDRFKKRWGIL